MLAAMSPLTTITFTLPPATSAATLHLPGTAVVDGASVQIETERPTQVLADVTGAAAALGLELDSLTVRRPSLEDVFLALGGEASP